ncbi:hypothetical protein [Glaciibacter superstes]|uniref:hypothetical protein n=1 Tax=Glaciibacter superstes TaxID=501023 RepID=UPI00047AC074|nr:hypothetical protein [Glaciibacter superstes]
MCIQEPVLFGEVSRAPGGEFGSFGSCGRGEAVQLGVQRFAEHVDGRWWDADVAVVVGDEFLDVGGVDGLLGAVRDALVSAGADEVGVDRALPGAGMVDQEP